MKKVVAYCRVSTSSKDQSNSFENQKTYFEREIKKNPDYKLVDIYADRGVSGTKLNRPEFDRMLFDAGLDIIEVKNENSDNRKNYKKYVTVPSNREPKFNMIFAKNTSRFARNVEVESIVRDLARKGVYVYFIDLSKCTENQEDITYIQIFQSFDERDSRDKSKKVQFGLQEGRRKGNIYTNSRLYGYDYIQAENRLKAIESEAIIIRKIFELYSSGWGCRRIINYLADNSLYTRQNKPFGITTVRNILQNEKYAGLNNPNKFDAGLVFNKNSYSKVRDEYDVNPTDKIEAIITTELFYECQEILHKKVNHQKAVGIYTGVSKYANLLYCNKCGSKYYSNQYHNRHFYNCKLKKEKGTKACDNRNVTVKYLDEYFQSYFNNKLYLGHAEEARHEITMKLYSDMFNLIDMYDTDTQEQVNEIERQIKDYNTQIGNIISLVAMGGTVAEQANGKLEEINILIEQLYNKKKILNNQNVIIRNSLIEINNEIKRIDEIENVLYQSTDDMINDISKVIVNDLDLRIITKQEQSIIDTISAYSTNELIIKEEINISKLTDEEINKYMKKYDDIVNG